MVQKGELYFTMTSATEGRVTDKTFGRLTCRTKLLEVVSEEVLPSERLKRLFLFAYFPWNMREKEIRKERTLFLYACPLTHTHTKNVDSGPRLCVQIWLPIITHVRQCSMGISNLIGLNIGQWPGCPQQDPLCGIHRRQTPLPWRSEGS